MKRLRFAAWTVLALIGVVAIFPDFLSPYSPTRQHRDLTYAPPGRSSTSAPASAHQRCRCSGSVMTAHTRSTGAAMRMSRSMRSGTMTMTSVRSVTLELHMAYRRATLGLRIGSDR